MKNTVRYILMLLIAVTLMGSEVLSAPYVASRPDTCLSLEFYFRFDSSAIDTLYQGNDTTLQHISRLLEQQGDRLSGLRVLSESSPEGPYLYNKGLS